MQVEFYTLEYAESLAASQQTWPLAAEYFAWCPVHGESSLIRLLEGLPLASSSDRMAMKAIQASRHLTALNALVYDVCLEDIRASHVVFQMWVLKSETAAQERLA